MTRKKFVNLLISRGYDKRTASNIANMVRDRGDSYRVIFYNPWKDEYTDEHGDVVDISTILESSAISVFKEIQEDIIAFDFDGNPIQLIYGYDLEEDSLVIFFEEAENMFFNGEMCPIYNIYDILNPNDLYLLKYYKKDMYFYKPSNRWPGTKHIEVIFNPKE